MKIIEYRLYMPLTVEENLIGQLWSFAEISRLNTSGGEGVAILHNEEFDIPLDSNGSFSNKDLPEYEITEETSKKTKSKKKSKSSKKQSTKNGQFLQSFENEKDDDIKKDSVEADDEDDEEIEELDILNTKENIYVKKGQYTRKNYFMASKFPWYVRKVLPKDLATIHERSWNMYPTVKTILTNDYFKSNFRIQLDTITRSVSNGQAEDNVHNLTEEQLAKREIIEIDITEPVDSSEYKASEDPLLFKSTKTDRGPLTPGWIKSQKPLICVYKLICLDFKVFGLQTKVENYMRQMYRGLFKTFHRQIWCWSDNWYGMTIENVRDIERNLVKLLENQIEEGEISKVALSNAE